MQFPSRRKAPQNISAGLAQLVELLVYTEVVGGSSPSPCTILSPE